MRWERTHTSRVMIWSHKSKNSRREETDNAFEDVSALLQKNNSIRNSHHILREGKGGCEHIHNEVDILDVKQELVSFI